MNFCISHPYRFRVEDNKLMVSKWEEKEYGFYKLKEWEFDLTEGDKK